MPGTMVHDASVPALVATATVTANIAASWVQTGRANVKRVRLQVTGTVSGTSPTLDVVIQAADDGSGTNAVTLGRFTQSTATGVNKYIDVDCQKPYMAAVVTVGGTSPSFAGTTVTVEEERYQRTATDAG